MNNGTVSINPKNNNKRKNTQRKMIITKKTTIITLRTSLSTSLPDQIISNNTPNAPLNARLQKKTTPYGNISDKITKIIIPHSTHMEKNSNPTKTTQIHLNPNSTIKKN